MADDIRFEDFPLQNYFSKDLKSLLLGLTDKIPSKRLGHCSNGGIDAIKKHAFFKKVDWSSVLDKQLTPPIIPTKRAKNDVAGMCDGASNPYALLSQNFDKKHYDRQINLFDGKDRLAQTNQQNLVAKTSFVSRASNDSGHLSNFTYDKDILACKKLGNKLSKMSSTDNSLLRTESNIYEEAHQDQIWSKE